MGAEITQSLLESNLDAAYLLSGREYFKSGHVEKLQFDPAKQQVKAEVVGSGAKPYKVFVEFDEQDIDGDCSCTLQFNCKHVAATLYAVMDEHSVLPRKKRKKKEEAVPFHHWLGVVNQNTPSQSRDEYPTDVRQRLLYILRPDMKHGLRLHFESIRMLKNDGY
ncbi:MAG: SWIM zinc finger family protein, partial [Ghiorsea sp.]